MGTTPAMDSLDQLRGSLPSIEHMMRGLAGWLPRALAAAGVVLVGWLLAKLLRAVARSLLGRLRRALLSRRVGTEGRSVLEEQGVEILSTAVFWGVLFVSGMFATETLGLPVVTTWLAGVTAYLPRILLALSIIVASLVAAGMVESIANRFAESLGTQGAHRIGRLARGALLILGLLVALQQLGIDVSFVTTGFFIVLSGAVAGAALAFGLGCQTVVSNILAMHYVRRSFRPGDRVRIGTAEGKIVRTTPIAVVLETDDGEVNVPARDLVTQVTIRLPDEGSP